MKRLLLLLAALTIPATARTWTSADGSKEIEAELVRVEGDKVVILMNGKERSVAPSYFSEADRDHIREFVEKQAAEQAASVLEFLGSRLQPGARTVVETELSEKTRRALAGNALKPTRLKIAIELPADFDPNQPQKVFWPCGGINNEAERASGNLARMDSFAAAAASLGWIVIAADTEHGNPRESTVAVCKGDAEFHHEVVAHLAAHWPGFKDWQHACGGNSSGAKASFFRTAQLREAGVNVIGIFLGGCNQSMAKAAAEETGVRSRQLKQVKAWQSTGDNDKLVNAGHVESVTNGLDDAGYGKVRAEGFSGGHEINLNEFKKALAWFVDG